MEQLNSVTLRGIIGSVRVQDIQDRKVANFTVATNFAFKGRDGEAIIETTWHNVTAWSGGKTADLANLQKGQCVEVHGRLRNQRYTSSDGTERSSVDILAREVKVLDDRLVMESGL